MLSSARDARLQIVIRVTIAAACLAIAIWGIWLCGDFVHSPTIAGPYPSLNDLIGVLCWLIFFVPFAALGIMSLRRARAISHLLQAQRRLQEAVQILPPVYSGPMPPRQPVPVVPRTSAPEPLDDATRRRLEQVASRAAKLAGVIFGSLLLIGGIAGFVLAWLQSHSPPSTFSSPNGGFRSFSLTVYFLIGCAGCGLLGAHILRETFARPKTGWLAPLGVFGAIVRRQADAEQAQKKLRE